MLARVFSNIKLLSAALFFFFYFCFISNERGYLPLHFFSTQGVRKRLSATLLELLLIYYLFNVFSLSVVESLLLNEFVFFFALFFPFPVIISNSDSFCVKVFFAKMLQIITEYLHVVDC